MTSLRMMLSWKCCLIGTTILQAVVIISTSGSSCSPDEACHPPSVQLADQSFPLRNVSVSSTCGAYVPTAYCSPQGAATCNEDSPLWCDGEHTAEHMLDWTTSSGHMNPDLTTYWQSENSIGVTGAQPITQYVEVRSI